jgi:hypothetical protein
MLMDKVLILLLTLTITQSLAQVTSNRHDRITREEFQELLKHKDVFVPSDLGDAVVIVRYSGQKLMEMQNKARNISFAKNGSDTTGLRNQSWLTEKQIEKSKVAMEKFASDYPVKLAKELKKKGIKSVIVDENRLYDNSNYSNMYWLRTTFISTQKSLTDNGWVMTTTNMFHDPRTDKDFEIFLPLNYSLIELVQ